MGCGAVYWSTGKYEKALHDYGKCIRIMEALHVQNRLYDPIDLAKAYMNRGNAFQSTGKLDKALCDYDTGIHIMEDLKDNGKLNEISVLASTMLNKGILLFTEFQDADSAMKIWSQAIDLLENQDSLSYATNYTLGLLYQAVDEATDNKSV